MIKVNEVNFGEEIRKVLLPDYVFSRLILEFRKLKPKEGIAVLYGTYEGKAVKAEKIWVPPKKYLKSTPTGVKLTEMGRKYHSTVDHFEILSDTSPIAWVHSHPIEAPSEIDKTTQRIAQLFQVPVGIFLNYKKLDTPKEAVKAFRIGKNQKVEYIPIQVVRTKAIAPPHPVKIEHPEFSTLKKKTRKFHSSLEAYSSAFEDYLSSLPKALSKVAKASTEGYSNLSQEILETQSRTLQAFEEARKKVMRELKDFSKEIRTWKEELEENIAEHHMTTREKLEGIDKQIGVMEKKREKELEDLQEIMDGNRETVLAQQEHLQDHLFQKVDEVTETLQKALHRTANLLSTRLEEEQNKIRRDLKEDWEEIKKTLEEEDERIETIQATLEKNQQKTEEQFKELREKTTKLEKNIQESLENEIQTNKLLKSLKKEFKETIRDEVTKVWNTLQESREEEEPVA